VAHATTIIPALRRLRQEDPVCKACLGFIMKQREGEGERKRERKRERERERERTWARIMYTLGYAYRRLSEEASHELL
jgi:hypothetical protein